MYFHSSRDPWRDPPRSIRRRIITTACGPNVRCMTADGDVAHVELMMTALGSQFLIGFPDSVWGYTPDRDLADQCGAVVVRIDRAGECGGAAVAHYPTSCSWAIRPPRRHCTPTGSDNGNDAQVPSRAAQGTPRLGCATPTDATRA